MEREQIYSGDNIHKIRAKKRFELIYNGIKSEFNASENGGRGGSMRGNKWVSWFVNYSVRPSKANKLNISELIEYHKEDGSIEWSFYSRIRVERGHKVIVRELECR